MSSLLLVLREKLVDRLQPGLDDRAVGNTRLFDELIVHLQFFHDVDPGVTVSNWDDLIDVADFV